MQIELTPDDIETLILEADMAARKLRRRLGLPGREVEDLGQDLLVDLLRRLPAFDRSRGTLGAFAGIILKNQSSRIALRIMRTRDAENGGHLSLDAPRDAADPRPLGDTLSEDDGLAAWYGQPTCAHLAFERRHALHCAVSHLSCDQRALCQALAHRPVAALVADGFASRSSLYRRLSDLRHVLTAYGIGPAWDDFAAA